MVRSVPHPSIRCDLAGEAVDTLLTLRGLDVGASERRSEISRTSFVLTASTNCSRSRTGTMNAPEPPITQSR